MSLLLSEGHATARRYPIIVVWQEAQIVRERVNQRHITETVLMQAVAAATMSKKGGKHLADLLKDLGHGR